MNWREYQKSLFGEMCWGCGKTTVWHTRNQKKCCRCSRYFHYINRQKEWELLKEFCVESTSYSASRNLEVDKNTAHKHFMKFRLEIQGLADKERKKNFGEFELDESYFGGKRKGKRGRGAANKVKVFGILERSGKVCTVVVPNVTKEVVLNKQ